MDLTLVRTSRSPVCTQGTLSVNDQTFQTLERPWVPDPSLLCIAGDPGQSCVLPGKYDLALHDSAKHPKTFALVNPLLGVIHLPSSLQPHFRSAILIHAANVPSELEGCIALGLTSGDCAVWNSQAALRTFYSLVPWVVGHTLTIMEEFPGE